MRSPFPGGIPAIDLAILLLYLAAVLWIGLRAGKRPKTVEQFALGGHQIPWWAVLGSLIAAETSAAFFLGTPTEGYALGNYEYLQLALGTVLARVLVAYLFVKPYFTYRVTSIYQFLALRFGPKTKSAASATFLLTRLLASGARLYVAVILPVLAVKLLWGRPISSGQELWIYAATALLLTLFTTIYTVAGGIRAVIWTDLLQASLMLSGGILTLLLLFHRIPWTSSSPLAEAAHLLAALPWAKTGVNPQKDLWENLGAVLSSDYTIWAALIGSTFTTMATHGADQDLVQRLLTAKNYHRSRLSLILSGLSDVPLVFLFLTIGIFLGLLARSTHDPHLPSQANEVFPYFILCQTPSGIRGLLLAAIFATAMGSLSAALNALATSFCEDWAFRFLPTASDQKSRVRLLRGSTVLFALLSIAIACATAFFALHSPRLRILPIVLGLFGYTYGPLLGVFLLGVLTRSRGNDFGNCIAMACGLAVVTILSGVPQAVLGIFSPGAGARLPWLPCISFPWRVFVGSCATFLVGLCFRSSTQPYSAAEAAKSSF
ncbi:sodium:solute symporter family transporter [Methylacidimicrobium tartarophylax]|uniref:Sodium/glucose cotransporter n=1 Tax=Methylacidimicrobium tartarophylax TaxID=1041768 RepID=A0A5E6M8R8_9BACT|nr:sodium:proline symporter [Methylacidimicrobium tartarophylax]VVM04707.1 Sodium/glucose cotransporter [Methylacidimicrobium tartarophylax]